MFASRTIIYAYVGGNPVNDIDPTGESSLALGGASGLAGGGGASGGLGAILGAGARAALGPLGVIAGALTPSTAGEGSDIVPKQCPTDDYDCLSIIGRIFNVMRQLNSRYMDQCRNKKNQWDDHVQAFEDTKRLLAKLIDEAEMHHCPVPPQAYVWLQTQCPLPGTPRNNSPGY